MGRGAEGRGVLQRPAVFSLSKDVTSAKLTRAPWMAWSSYPSELPLV